MKKILTLLLTLFCAIAHAQLIIYPAPKEGVEMKDDFHVEVREKGGKWQTLDTYAVKVDRVEMGRHKVEKASLAYFDFNGEVEVAVTYRGGNIESGRVRPLSYGIEPQVDGNKMTFSLSQPCNLSVEVNGDIFHNLHLFANPIDTHQPKIKENKKKEGNKKIKGNKKKNSWIVKKDKNLVYFAPGLHQLPDSGMVIGSGKTVYIAGGAVVRGCLYVNDAENVRIYGRGIIHPAGRGEGVRISRSRNVEVDGIITTQCPTGGSDGVVIRNVKAITSYGWGDGLNIFASNNVLMDSVFCRTSDDCTTVYGTRKGYVGGCRNITMQNSTLWADVAHPIFIGIHGNVENPEILENLNFVNIDILDHKEKQIDYQGCLAINAGDENLIRKVRFENIRIEDFREGQLVNLRIFFNEKYCKAPGRGIEDVLFKDITYTGKNANLSMIIGYDKERKVKNICFDNLVINGVRISDNMPGKPGWYKTADMGQIFVGEHTENVIFK